MIDPRRQRELKQLIDRLGISSNISINWQLIDQALIHPTFSAAKNNDYLEFIGDSVLRLAASLFLRDNFSSSSVGEIAKLRSHLVSDRVLAEIAASFDLDRFMVMSEAARRDATAVRSRLADGLEALMAALYLSSNDLSLIRLWLDPFLAKESAVLMADPTRGNYKAALQELTQRHWKLLPEYRNIKLTENDCSPVSREPDLLIQPFTVEVWLKGRCWGRGQGTSIKSAQQAAAALAVEALTAALPEHNFDFQDLIEQS